MSGRSRFVWRAVALLAGAALAAVACGWFGLAWSASSAAWWTGETPGWPALVRGLTRWLGGDLALATLAGVQGTALVVGCVAAAWRLRGPAAAGVAVALGLVWPDARALLSTVSAEATLALVLLLVLHASWLLPAWPRWGALLLALGLVLGVGAHPLALPMMPVLMVLPLAWPRLDVGGDAAVGPRPRPVLTAWLAGVCLALGLLLAVAPAGGWKRAWTLDLGVLRASQSGLEVGGLASLPGIGPLVTWLGRTPAAIAALSLGCAVRTWRRPALEGPLAALLGLCLLALAWAGLPVPGHLDGVRLLAPLVVVLAAVAVVDVAAVDVAAADLRALARRGPARFPQAAGPALALLGLAALALAADLALLAGAAGRSSIGRLPGVLADPGPTRPAELDRDALALVARYRSPTALLPARAGGQALGAALPLVEPSLRGVYFGPAYASQLVLIDQPAWHPLDRAWMSVAQPLACAGHYCVVRRAAADRPR